MEVLVPADHLAWLDCPALEKPARPHDPAAEVDQVCFIEILIGTVEADWT